MGFCKESRDSWLFCVEIESFSGGWPASKFVCPRVEILVEFCPKIFAGGIRLKVAQSCRLKLRLKLDNSYVNRVAF